MRGLALLTILALSASPVFGDIGPPRPPKDKKAASTASSDRPNQAPKDPPELWSSERLLVPGLCLGAIACVTGIMWYGHRARPK